MIIIHFLHRRDGDLGLEIIASSLNITFSSRAVVLFMLSSATQKRCYTLKTAPLVKRVHILTKLTINAGLFLFGLHNGCCQFVLHFVRELLQLGHTRCVLDELVFLVLGIDAHAGGHQGQIVASKNGTCRSMQRFEAGKNLALSVCVCESTAN